MVEVQDESYGPHSMFVRLSLLYHVPLIILEAFKAQSFHFIDG